MSPARILVAEDEPITAEDISDILTHLGYEVTAVVSTGTDAVLEAENTRPDLAIMDINLKGEMDGVMAARTLRERFDIPVVYLTAHTDPATISRAKLSEPLGYLVKPFQEPELRAAIEIALHKHSVDGRAKKREQRLAATVDAIGEGVVALDGSGFVTLMNSAAEAWTGWKQSEARGKSIREILQLVEARTRRPADKSIYEALAGCVTGIQANSVIVGRDGIERAVEGSVAPVRDHKGTLSGAVVVFGHLREPASAVLSAEPIRQSRSSSPVEIPKVISESPIMKEVVKFAARVAQSEASAILLQGESGTGKDVLAKYLHYTSERRSHPFQAINCAAIPETLLESELFGYEKGAFTDARAQKKGALELANGGTVFLDEIGDMPLSLQAKLLRVLEDQCFRRLGGLQDIQLDLRVITATNRDLSDAIDKGKFRLDLYYRLNMIQIFMPPLRHRPEDILPLAQHFVSLYSRKLNRHIEGISREAAEVLLKHAWPGNVRELRNTVERAMILEDAEWVQSANLGLGQEDSKVFRAVVGGESTRVEEDPMSLEDAERVMLKNALDKSKWNQTKAARLLKITRDMLRYKMKKHRLQQSH